MANAVAGPGPDACVPDWYCSYFGTYSVDWQTHRWTIHVAGANIPSFVGTDRSRSFAFTGDTLAIADSNSNGARTIHAERVLVRAR